jgi:formylglycine-generating enzyme required for sulfatase activity
MTKYVICLAFLASAVFSSEISGRCSKDVYTPIVHQKYWQLEKELFGYEPAFMPNTVTFDERNRPYIRRHKYVQTLDDNGNWLKLDFTASISKAYPKWDGNFVTMTNLINEGIDEPIVFDTAGRAYMFISIQASGTNSSNMTRSLYMVSDDYCRSWKCYEIPMNPRFVSLEHNDVFNEITGPPTILATENYGFIKEGLDASWFIVPRFNDKGEIVFRDPIKLCDSGAVYAFHSGDTNTTVTKDGKTYIFYIDISYSKRNQTPGTATFARVYDHRSGEMSEPVFLGLGGDYIDYHNWPAVQLDSENHLHVLLGSHHEPFKYMRSVEPLDIHKWTNPVEIGVQKRLLGERNYTYPAFLIDYDDNMHLVSRWGGMGVKQYLAYQRKPAGGEWEPMEILVEPFTNLYANWDHKINIDRYGRLFINYSQYSNQELRPDEARAYQRMFPEENIELPDDLDEKVNGVRIPNIQRKGYSMLVSEDIGKNWRLAVTEDFADYVKPEKKADIPAEKNFVNTVGMKFTLIEPGSFFMGSDEGRYDETPAHKVFITKPYYLGIHEVTVAQFREFTEDTGYKTAAEDEDNSGWIVFMSGENISANWNRAKLSQQEKEAKIAELNWRNPGYDQSDDHPVVVINIDDARAFCKWLSDKEGIEYRLPTEAEWEYACRGGTQTPYSFPVDSRLSDFAWYTKNADGSAHPVGQKCPNPWGLYDMHGNVWEFTSSYYGHYDGSVKIDPKAATDKDNMRVGTTIKGGSWIDDVRGDGDGFNLRSASRNNQCYPRCKTNWIGFRVAAEAKESK